MISDNNTNNPQDEKNKLLYQSSTNVSEIGNKEQKECSNTSEKPPNYKTKNSFIEWCNRFNPINQFIVMVLGILTLIAYVFVSLDQSIKIQQNIVLADSARFQNREAIELTKQSGISSDSLSRKAILIADSSMKVSSKIAELQEKFSKVELRAYIAIEDINIITFHSNKKIICDVFIANTGKTPAYNLNHSSGIKLGGTGLYDVEFERTKKSILDNKLMIGSGIRRNITIEGDILSINDSVQIANNIKVFYIFGSIFYNDIFGERHWTKFCYQYYAPKNLFYSYNRYNDAD